jgi:hypothetical protein
MENYDNGALNHGSFKRDALPLPYSSDTSPRSAVRISVDRVGLVERVRVR